MIILSCEGPIIALRRIDLFLVELFNFIPVIYFYGAFLAIRAGSFAYFAAGNPIIKYRRTFGNESAGLTTGIAFPMHLSDNFPKI